MSTPVELVFARHGNTFRPGETAVMVGRRSDLPLVERGLEQAHEAAVALKKLGLIPSVVISAGLKRTRGFAEMICADLGGIEQRVDSRLDEIDYGAWEGLSNEQIQALPGGKEAQDAWQKNDTWPISAGWATTQAEVLDNLGAVLADLVAGRAGTRPLIVSSNGILRFAPRLLGAPTSGSLQLKTGALGCLEQPAGAWAVRFWGMAPKDA